MLGDNQRITPEELEIIRSLDDFDLKMLLSEIHDNGWLSAKRLLPMILEAIAARKERAKRNGEK